MISPVAGVSQNVRAVADHYATHKQPKVKVWFGRTRQAHVAGISAESGVNVLLPEGPPGRRTRPLRRRAGMVVRINGA